MFLALDLEEPAEADYERLDGDRTEIESMLTPLFQKLTMTALTYFNNITGRQNLLGFRLVRVGKGARELHETDRIAVPAGFSVAPPGRR